MPRLIDENKAKEVLTDYYHIRTKVQKIALEEAFSRIPTVDIPTVDIPTVDAIPVEWIEEYLMPYREHYEKIRDEWKLTCSSGWVIDVIEIMLRKWEKENAKVD